MGVCLFVLIFCGGGLLLQVFCLKTDGWKLGYRGDQNNEKMSTFIMEELNWSNFDVCESDVKNKNCNKSMGCFSALCLRTTRSHVGWRSTVRQGFREAGERKIRQEWSPLQKSRNCNHKLEFKVDFLNWHLSRLQKYVHLKSSIESLQVTLNELSHLNRTNLAEAATP